MLVFLNNLQIRTRLMLMIGLVLATAGSILGTSRMIFKTAQVNGPMYGEIVQGKDLVADILPPPEYILETYLNVHLLLAENDAAQQTLLVEKLKALRLDFNDRLEHWQSSLPAGEIKQCLSDEVAPPAKEFYEVLEASFLPAIRAKKSEQAKAIVAKQLKPLYETHRKAIDKLADLGDKANRGVESRAAEYVSGWTWRLTAFAIVGVLLSVVFAGGVALSISRPLSACAAFAEGLAAGDLTRTLEVRQENEIGRLIVALNAMGGKLREMFANIVKNTQALAGSANELSSTATQLASGAEETTNQSNSVAAAAEEMSANMTSVAASTEQMSANVRAVSSAVEQLTASITEVARSAEQAAHVAGNAASLAGDGNAKISELGAAATEIGKVIEVIEDIAEQTSLLALNATIEAARAGDAGKGFAVVASEVKELAKQTAAATEDIRRRIEGIQLSSGQAVRSIGEITAVIKQVNEVSRTIASAVEEQSITTREIAKNVAETSTAAQTVARGVAESASVTREIAKNIVEVDLAARHTAQGATIAQSAGGKVARVVEELSATVGQFKLGTAKRFEAEPIKTAHALWSAKLADLLAGRISLDPSEVAKHTECKFGKWYHGDASKPLAGLAAFRTIGEEHAKFHELARLIAELHKNGRKREAAQKLSEARSLTQNLFRLLDDLEQKANAAVTAA
jgi:methyl-accepting chemotaxis protein